MSTTDEPEDDGRITKEEAVLEAFSLLRRAPFGVLSTISKSVQGWPFGSVVPYAVDRRGAPLILIASIAEHTKNVLADDRVSLLVHDSAGDGDVQAQGRVTVLARARPVEEAELKDARARYLARVPSASDYFDTHDFRFFRLEPVRVRFIGGFGQIFWLDAASFAIDPAADPLAPRAKGIIDHMNEDHADTLITCCKAFSGFEPKKATMVGVDQFGLDVECEDPAERVRFDFESPATPENVRAIVVDLVRRARSKLEAK
jgi:heme iron utilization protein